ncbi:hypothetical protein [Amycolatopsis sp. cmx-11-51]|uniref:hypothetical protein n=1 Tax=unclassified Amycolatopsis TaxID=2618356 RepID=UPI0039E4D537
MIRASNRFGRLAAPAAFTPSSGSRSWRTDGAEVYVLSALFSEGQEQRLLDQVGVAAGYGMWVVLSQYCGATGGMAAFGGSGVWKPGGAAEVRLGGEVSEWACATITS